ncbi:MAG TPA: acyl carrier protein [Polyangiaceae bacterium LLY-WYZ-15_(1-7)]|nr:hypothetical protein [Myxococcales bacterium]MAT28223.1 hypothetical protein [Sandaracinus sp.]HJK95506.1 acyl carrier protein [Polyangiaceae bacterium LLY-WYZ-15_(1-7)]MBJ75306.1 hypothetical protein [Sandaracinus sp.]HJL05953.1 acyl carrier protein [Polyangiaceae bacterium LLY-WYZ-15_(1-7)]
MDRTKLLVFFHAEASEIAERDLGHATEDTLIADLGLDSLSVLELVGSLERELALELPTEALDGVETIGQLFDVIEARAPHARAS